MRNLTQRDFIYIVYRIIIQFNIISNEGNRIPQESYFFLHPVIYVSIFYCSLNFDKAHGLAFRLFEFLLSSDMAKTHKWDKEVRVTGLHLNASKPNKQYTAYLINSAKIRKYNTEAQRYRILV